MDLLFDTETTGLPGRSADPSHPAFPHIVQLALALREPSSGSIINAATFIVLPEAPFSIHPKAAEVHGITPERCQAQGIPASKALSVFRLFARLSTRLVAYNLPFDLQMIHALAWRSNVGIVDLHIGETFDPLPVCTRLCELPPTEAMIKFGHGHKFKPPKLQEAYQRLVDPAGFERAHDAFADVLALNAILNKLQEIGQ